jgi:amidase
LAAFFVADLTADRREAVVATAQSLSADDRSIAACRVRGFTISHADWILATRQRAALRGRWLALFEDVDVVLCPAMPTPAFLHDHAPMASRELDIDGRKRSYFDQLAWAGPATVNGLPATTAPIGRTETGLPTGVQIIGCVHGDRGRRGDGSFALARSAMGQILPFDCGRAAQCRGAAASSRVPCVRTRR